MRDARRLYDIMRGQIGQTWERLQDLEKQLAESELNQALSGPVEAQTPPPAPTLPVDQDAKARQILGVEAGATFAEIQKAYQKLAKRSRPGLFPAGSEEEKQAKSVHEKVQWAFSILSRDASPLEKRFSSLEID